MADPTAEALERYDRRFGLFGGAAAGVWLIFLVPPLQRAWDERGAWAGWVGMAAVLGFGALYVCVFRWSRPMRRSGAAWASVQRSSVWMLVGLFALAVVMVVTLHADGLGSAVYIAVAGVILLPQRWAIPLAVTLAVATEAMARLIPGWQDAAGIWLAVTLGTFAMWGMWQALRRNMELVRAKEENAQLLVGQERARLGRDLHDLLGHSLTVIAVKAELAERLVEVSPERAKAELADLQRLARDALADVRRTVDGYRELSLPAEISRAGTALEAAGIVADLPGSTDEVASPFRELFAWTVREGVTNVVRHSAARHCTVTLTAHRVTVADDGRGMRDAQRATGEGGHGLNGLKERAAAVGARVVTQTGPSGGFSLTVLDPAVGDDREREQPAWAADPAANLTA